MNTVIHFAPTVLENAGLGAQAAVLTLGLIALAVAFLCDISGGGVIATALVLGFHVGSFAVSPGPVAWLLTSEIFPLAVRGRASSVATLANRVADVAVAVSYLSIISAIGETATFGAHVVVTVLALVHVVTASRRRRTAACPTSSTSSRRRPSGQS